MSSPPPTTSVDLPGVIPVFPLDSVLLPPRGLLPLNIFEPRYLNMIDDAMASDRIIGLVQTRPGGERERPSLARVGGAGRITSFAETQDGRYLITLTGVCRFRLGPELAAPTPYRQVRADYRPFEQDLAPPEDAGVDRTLLLNALKLYLGRRNLEVDWRLAMDAPLDALVNSLSMALPFTPQEKQALLEAVTIADRVETMTILLRIEAAGEDGDGPSARQ
jgi:Lon protease-like protein